MYLLLLKGIRHLNWWTTNKFLLQRRLYIKLAFAKSWMITCVWGAGVNHLRVQGKVIGTDKT